MIPNATISACRRASRNDCLGIESEIESKTEKEHRIAQSDIEIASGGLNGNRECYFSRLRRMSQYLKWKRLIVHERKFALFCRIRIREGITAFRRGRLFIGPGRTWKDCVRGNGCAPMNTSSNICSCLIGAGHSSGTNFPQSNNTWSAVLMDSNLLRVLQILQSFSHKYNFIQLCKLINCDWSANWWQIGCLKLENPSWKRIYSQNKKFQSTRADYVLVLAGFVFICSPLYSIPIHLYFILRLMFFKSTTHILYYSHLKEQTFPVIGIYVFWHMKYISKLIWV